MRTAASRTGGVRHDSAAAGGQELRAGVSAMPGYTAGATPMTVRDRKTPKCGVRRGALPLVLAIALASPALAADTRSTEAKLLRLSEILGAVHYLRELCGAKEGTAWRESMRQLLDKEGSSALKRVQLTASFNKGYRSYRRTYQSCTPTAETVVNRFLAEGVAITDSLVTGK
jgi:uncharacterized protein (TIGR02301 family)